jgi:hypothetical protein
MNRSIRIIFLIFLIFFTDQLCANLLFDETVPEKLREGISQRYKELGLKNSFLIEIQSKNSLLIVGENGFMRTLPLKQVTAADVINVMENMIGRVLIAQKKEVKDEKESEKIKKFIIVAPKPDEKKDYVNQGIKVSDNIEFFPWNDSSERFGVNFFASSEENWAGGLNVSAGLAFIRVGLDFRKGADLIFDEDKKVGWQAFGAFVQFDLLDLYGIYLSVGFKIGLYTTRGKLFEREFFNFKLAYRLKWFEVSGGINVSPSVVELGLFGEKYTMERYHFVISTGFFF